MSYMHILYVLVFCCDLNCCTHQLISVMCLTVNVFKVVASSPEFIKNIGHYFYSNPEEARADVL